MALGLSSRYQFKEALVAALFLGAFFAGLRKMGLPRAKDIESVIRPSAFLRIK